MWSGKSEVLIELLEKHNDRGALVFAFNSDKNNRDDKHKIVSRAGAEWPAKRVSDDFLDPDGAFFEHHSINSDLVIGVDEGQFFGDKLVELATLARRRDAKFQLIVAGLLLDSENRPFGPMAPLRAITNLSIGCTAWCQKCDAIAYFTYSNTPKEGQVRVGDSGYEPRCETCYRSGEAEKASMGYLS
jgi:thymidine kinase